MAEHQPIYRHYKGKEYDMIGIAFHSETMEELVIYRARYTDPKLGSNPMFARPKDMFFGEVTVDGKTIPRFIKL